MINIEEKYHIFYNENKNIKILFTQQNKLVDLSKNATKYFYHNKYKRPEYICVDNALFKIDCENCCVVPLITSEKMYADNYLDGKTNCVIYKQNNIFYYHNLLTNERKDITRYIDNYMLSFNYIPNYINFYIGDKRFILSIEQQYGAYHEVIYGVFDIEKNQWILEGDFKEYNCFISEDFLNGKTNLFAVIENNNNTCKIFCLNRLLLKTTFNDNNIKMLFNGDTKYICVYDKNNNVVAYEISNNLTGKLKKLHTLQNIKIYNLTANRYFVMSNESDKMLMVFDMKQSQIVKYVNNNIFHFIEHIYKTDEISLPLVNNICNIVNVIDINKNIFILFGNNRKAYVGCIKEDNSIEALTDKHDTPSTHFFLDKSGVFLGVVTVESKEGYNNTNIYVYNLETKEKMHIHSFKTLSSHVPMVKCIKISENLLYIKLTNNIFDEKVIIYDIKNKKIHTPLTDKNNVIIQPLINNVWSCFIVNNTIYDKNGQEVYNVKSDTEKIKSHDVDLNFKNSVYPLEWYDFIINNIKQNTIKNIFSGIKKQQSETKKITL